METSKPFLFVSLLRHSIAAHCDSVLQAAPETTADAGITPI